MSGTDWGLVALLGAIEFFVVVTFLAKLRRKYQKRR